MSKARGGDLRKKYRAGWSSESQDKYWGNRIENWGQDFGCRKSLFRVSIDWLRLVVLLRFCCGGEQVKEIGSVLYYTVLQSFTFASVLTLL